MSTAGTVVVLVFGIFCVRWIVIGIFQNARRHPLLDLPALGVAGVRCGVAHHCRRWGCYGDGQSAPAVRPSATLLRALDRAEPVGIAPVRPVSP
jgi:hypothetical protein